MPSGDGDMIEQTDAWTDFDAAEVFDAFGGCWRQVRVIAPGGRFCGMATFTALDVHTLAYHEEGIAAFYGGATLPCYRDYTFRLEAEQIAVYFDDPSFRLFHRLRPCMSAGAALRARAHHRCGQDDYWSTYTFNTRRNFLLQHRVKGPRKNYLMSTWYSKL